jgi:hypothetical protein
MRLATGGTLVTVKCRAVNWSTKIRTSLYMVSNIEFWRSDSTLFICLFCWCCLYVCHFELFVLFPLCSVCFHRNVLCLVCVMHRWMCLWYIVLHVYALCALFGTITMSGLCTVGGILVCICCCCHILASLLFWL